MVDGGEDGEPTVIWLDPKGSFDDAGTSIQYAQLIRECEMVTWVWKRETHIGEATRVVA